MPIIRTHVRLAVKWVWLERAFAFSPPCSRVSSASTPAPTARPGGWPGLLSAETCITPAGPGAVLRWDSVEPLPSWSLNVESVMQLSARNQIPARVTSINAGEAIANVELSANGVRLVASITVEAVRQLGLAEGSDVTA